MLRPLARMIRALAFRPSRNILLGSISTGVTDICINAPEPRRPSTTSLSTLLRNDCTRLKRCTIGEDDLIASKQAGLLGRRALYYACNHAAALHVDTRENANAGIGD